MTDSQAATDVLREILPGVNESTKTSTSILLRAIVARYMRTIIESPVLPDAHCPEGSISRRSRDLVEQTTRDIEGTIRTLFDVQLSEVLDADLKHLLYDAVKLALSFRRQEAIYMLEFPGQMQSDPETMLNFLGSAPAADRGTVLFAVFPAILKVRGEGQGKVRNPTSVDRVCTKKLSRIARS